MPTTIRVVYVGHHYEQSDDFGVRMKAALSRAFGEGIALEYEPTVRATEDNRGTWPSGISPPEQGKTTVLIRAENPFRCGTPAAAALFFSVITVGIFPFVDGDDVVWSTEIFDGPDHRVGVFPFEVRWGRYGWLPLTPFVPLNLAWRGIRGDEEDSFLREYPSHLRWQIGWYEMAALQRTPTREELQDRAKFGTGLR